MRGHGADVKQVDWHPTKGIIASGSKDLQSPIKLWDPKGGVSITTLYAHKGTVMDIQWNKNGHWLASAARDHLVKVSNNGYFDGSEVSLIIFRIISSILI